MARPARKGLGRGLASLIPDSAFDADHDRTPRGELRRVPIDEIKPNPEQPRAQFDEEALEGLTASIRTHGVVTPLVVRRHRGNYVLIAGERRLRAAGRAGLHEVPCVVREADTAQEQLELALVENLQRQDLDPIEAALGYRRLTEDFGLTQAEVAERVGKNRATVANAMRLLQLPDDLLERVQAGRLSAGHARALLPLGEDLDQLRTLADRTESEGWSVRALERQVARQQAQPRPGTTTSGKPDKSLDHATRLLQKALQTAVRIRPLKRGGGRIVLDYADAEELERLIAHLRAAPPRA